LGAWPLPPLETIVEAPVLRLDGSVLDVAGYDTASRLLYCPAPGLALTPLPAIPTSAQVAAARTLLLDELLGDFPFVDDAIRANAVAFMITPVVRPMIAGPIPLALLDKPGAGTGASLLADVVSLIATGREGAMMSAPREDEEWRKQITSLLLEGAAFVLIDNVVGRLRSSALSRVLTCTTWKARLLGKYVSIDVDQSA